MRRPVCSVAPLPGSGLAWDKGEWYSPLSSAMDDGLSRQFRLVTDACLTVESFRVNRESGGVSVPCDSANSINCSERPRLLTFLCPRSSGSRP